MSKFVDKMSKSRIIIFATLAVALLFVGSSFAVTALNESKSYVPASAVTESVQSIGLQTTL